MAAPSRDLGFHLASISAALRLGPRAARDSGRDSAEAPSASASGLREPPCRSLAGGSSPLAGGGGRGDEFIPSPFPFTAPAAPVRYAGARPVFVDVDPLCYALDPA